MDVPSSIGHAAARLDHPTLSIVLQPLTGHNYLSYHHYIVGSLSEQICRFCGDEGEEFIHLVGECLALAMERLGSVRGLQPSRQPPDLFGHVRLKLVSPIVKALERRASEVKHTGGLAPPGTMVY